MSRPTAKSNVGLSYLEDLSIASGSMRAEEYIRRLLGPEGVPRLFSVVDHGEPRDRVDVAPEDNITYHGYDPPALWNIPYSVQLVRFPSKRPHSLMYHPGEEILIPLHGAIQYRFYWGDEQAKPKLFSMPSAVRPGTILRVNPQIPHHTWAEGHEASAWMFFRHISNSPSAVILDTDANTKPKRRITAMALKKPGKYGLIAWGISEAIRTARLQSGLTVAELSQVAGTSPSSLSRIEDAKVNASIDLVLRICRILNINLLDLLISARWAYEEGTLIFGETDGSPLRRVQNPPHFLHPYTLQIAKNKDRIVPTCDALIGPSFASWIILKGKIVVDLAPLDGRSVLLDTGMVCHFCAPREVNVHALEHTELLKVTYSAHCHCGD